MAIIVPLSRPDITDAEVNAVADVMRSGWITTGKKVAEFEERFAEACGGDCYAVAVSSATAGMHLALEVLGWHERRVHIPVWTFSATAEAAEMADARLHFKDVDPNTLLMLPKTPSEGYDDKYLHVHMSGLLDFGYNVVDSVIFDAAHCLPHKCHDTAVYSFHANKPITTGEGGMIVFWSESHANAAKRLRIHGMNRDAHTRNEGWNPGHEISERGYKYNMTDMQAAMGLVQLERREEMRQQRAAIAAQYNGSLRGCMFPQIGDWLTHSFHQYIIRVPDREAYTKAMYEKGVQCGIHYMPLHRHKYWREKYHLKASDFPNAEVAYRNTVSLPIFSTMTDEQVAHVIKSSNECLA